MKNILIILLLVLFFYSCSDPTATATEDSSSDNKFGVVADISIQNDVFTNLNVDIMILKNPTIYGESAYSGDMISTANVSVNNIQLSYNSSGFNNDNTLLELSPGDDCTIRFRVDGKDYEFTETIPEQPIITGPTDQASVDPASDIALEWNPISTEISEIRVEVPWSSTPNENGYEKTLPATSVSHIIPGNTLLSISPEASYVSYPEMNVTSVTKLTNLDDEIDSNSYIIFKNSSTITLDTSL